MIIFKKIKFKNFLSYGNNVSELNLNRKSNTLIVGKNGTGKSTLIKLINDSSSPIFFKIVLDAFNSLLACKKYLPSVHK